MGKISKAGYYLRFYGVFSEWFRKANGLTPSEFHTLLFMHSESVLTLQRLKHYTAINKFSKFIYLNLQRKGFIDIYDIVPTHRRRMTRLNRQICKMTPTGRAKIDYFYSLLEQRGSIPMDDKKANPYLRLEERNYVETRSLRILQRIQKLIDKEKKDRNIWGKAHEINPPKQPRHILE